MGSSLIRNFPPLGPYSRDNDQGPMVVLGGRAVSDKRGDHVWRGVQGVGLPGYLAHKKLHPLRTLQKDFFRLGPYGGPRGKGCFL